MSIPIRDETFRPSFSRTLAGVLFGLGAFAAVSALGGETMLVVRIWAWVGLMCVVTWAVYWRPKVVVSPSGVRVVNVLRTIDVPWPAIDEVETRWALTLVTRLGTVRAWAAPAPGRQMMRRFRPEDRRMGGTRRGDVVRPSDLPQTESGAAAVIVRQQWERLREQGYLDDARIEFDRLPTRWHLHVIACVAALGALAAFVTWGV